VVSLCRDRGRDGNGFVVRMLADVEQGQGGFGEVAFIGDLPFVVGFDEHRAGQAQQGGGVGKDPDDVGAALDLFIESLEWVGAPDLFHCATGKSANAVMLSAASRSIVSTLGSWRPSMPAMVSSCSADVGGVGLGEDGADRSPSVAVGT
jgi:hypothetical protein